ncbi:class I SAM-dependent methyltransferase [Pseudomonas asplenii]|uniref:Methyltransferase domain n=1 Tax=Pseudomonas asplenii TaxID=53407 RepID=A0A0N0E1H8_9PSED|nr:MULTISPECIES: class I SAM-dependent methyltransferase [Pseudomonas]KPA87720.1 Methyltransferase domain [Pseudomonas fuscovaginae]
MNDSLNINKANWNDRAPVHARSAEYGLHRFLADPRHLSDVVRFDLPLLGDIAGLRGVHLQCHIGTDTLSLARLGASMTGLDFSPAALLEARALARGCGAELEFVEADVHAAAEVLPRESFDLVYTGIGALCWLPRIQPWARTVAALLKPGGRLFIREGHPMLWSLNEAHQEGLRVEYPYFEHEQPLVFSSDQTYVASDSPLTATVTHTWNHGLGEIVGALLEEGMTITGLVEHQSVPWDALPGQMVHSAQDDEWRLKQAPDRLPLSYTLQAVKRG